MNTTHTAATSTPRFPPGVLHKIEVAVGDDTWEITQFPDTPFWVCQDFSMQLVPGYQYITTDHLAEFKELIEGAEEARVKVIDSKLEAVKYCSKIEKLSNNAWEFNKVGSHCQGSGGCNIQHGMLVGGQRSWNWCQYRHEYTILTWDSSDMGAIGCGSPYIYDYYCAPIQGEVELTLDLAEEDWEYEQWLKEVDELTMILNLNAAQSRDPEERTGSNALSLNGRIWKGQTGWCGEVVETMGDSVDNMMSEWKKLGRCLTEIKHVHQGQIGYILLKDRYKVHAKILKNNFAETPYGIAWIPPKFRNCILIPGYYCFLTISKNSGEKLAKHRAQFTVIYIHTGAFAASDSGPSFR
jgi:hypothetical protein